MTKYILNSGGLRKYPDLAKKFLQEIVKDLGNNPSILLCFFALHRQEWELRFTEYAKNFEEAMPSGIIPSISLALPHIFSEQVKKSDAILIYGGDDHLLQYWLKKFDLPKIWEGKVVAGSSAGSDALSKHFWTCDWRMCMDGLGIVPIKFIPHFQSDYGDDDPRGSIDWDKACKELEQYGDASLPIHALKEGNFIVVSI